MLLPYVETGDKDRMMKLGAALGVGVVSYAAMTRYLSQRPVTAVAGPTTFKDTVECIRDDPVLCEAFLTLQQYRRLDKHLFAKALQTVDQLLFLERGLLNKDFPPSRADKTKGWALFRLSLNKLNEFQHMVRTTMKNEHAVVVNILVKKMYEQLQKHILNVLHLCSRFNPNDWLKMASVEVDEAVRRMDTKTSSSVRRKHVKNKWLRQPPPPQPSPQPSPPPPPVSTPTQPVEPTQLTQPTSPTVVVENVST